MPMKSSRYLETEDQAMKFLRGFINIVNPLGEHSCPKYWSYDKTNGFAVPAALMVIAVAAPAAFVVF